MRGLAAIFCLLTAPALAETPDIGRIVDTSLLPGYRFLADRANALAEAASEDCRMENDALRKAYADAFDAWVRVSHLRFGPAETDNHAAALAFWPEIQGATPKSLADLVTAADPMIDTLDGFQTVAVAARCFYALERLL